MDKEHEIKEMSKGRKAEQLKEIRIQTAKETRIRTMSKEKSLEKERRR